MPGVRELFEEEQTLRAKRTRAELYKGINPDYYGFRDDEDGILAKVEAVAEKRGIFCVLFFFF